MLFDGREECDGIFARIVEVHIWWRALCGPLLSLTDYRGGFRDPRGISGQVFENRGANFLVRQ